MTDCAEHTAVGDRRDVAVCLGVKSRPFLPVSCVRQSCVDGADATSGSRRRPSNSPVNVATALTGDLALFPEADDDQISH